MARVVTFFDVVYDDGTEATIRLTPRGTVEAERKFKGIGGYESTCFSAWVSDGKKGTFEQWLNSLKDIDSRVEEAEAPLGQEPPAEQ